MKKIVFIITILMSVFINLLVAQNYKHPQINQKGEVLDSQSVIMGYIAKDGTVKNAKGKKIGSIDHQGNIIDSKGRKLGKADKNGSFYNEAGVLEFEIKPTDADFCDMLDKNGQKLGTVHNDYKNQACAMHCFFKSENKKNHKQ